MKKVYLLLAMLTIAGMGIGQTTLSAGDIAIFGVNGDNPDDFGFVLLVDIDAGTEIRFTDSGWKSDNTFRGNEGAVKYTAPTALTAGTEITYQGNNSDFVADNDATVGNNGFNLSGSGDQVFAFQGASTSPTFIYAVQTNSNVWQTDATGSTNSAIPQGLTDGTNAAAVGHGSGAGDEWDNAAYDKDNSTMSGTAAVLLAAISNNSNWVGQNSPRYDLTSYDFTVNSGGTSPDAPANFSASTASTSEIDLSWTQNGNNDNVMVAYTTDGTFGTPSDGTSYSANDVISGGGTVLYNGSATTYNHTSLTSGTQYYYKAWSVDGSTNYSTGVTDGATTYKDEPSNHVGSFATGAPTSTTIPLTWLDNDGTVTADGFIVMINTTGNFTAPVDGTPQADDLDVSDGSGVVNVASGDEAYTWTNLSASTQYYFTIYPYTNSDAAIDYKTDGTVPTANATTTGAVTTSLPYSQTFDGDLGDCNQYSVSGTTKEWNWNSTDHAAQMNGYNSGDVEEDWLIIPGIDFDSYSNEIMTFDSWYKYGTDDADNYLKLLYSSDYPGSGDPSGYTWNELTFTHPASDQTWTSSGDIDLSTISGSSVYIAFKYHYNSGSYRGWEIDNISIQESTISPEPSNYPTDFAATANGIVVNLTWSENDGAVIPDGYIIMASTGTIADPVDGTDPADDTDLTDGSGNVEVAHGTTSYSFTNCSSSTAYNFKIYPYTNSGANIDYKTDGTAPLASATTGIPPDEPSSGDLEITEVNSTNSAYASYAEIYNTTGQELSLDKVDLEFYANGASTASSTLNLTGSIAAHSYIVIARKQGDFNTEYGFDPDFTFLGMYINGGADGLILTHDDNGTLDQFNAAPNGTVSMTDNHLYYRFNYPNNGTDLTADWDNSGLNRNGTPKAENKITWLTSGDTDWGTATNWDNGDKPSKGVDVIIPSGTYQPIVDESPATPGACMNMTINSGASVTVMVGGYLTVNGTLTNNNGTAAGLVVLSDNTGNGSLIVDGTVSGDATVQRYIAGYTAADNGWHEIGCPVSSYSVLNSNWDPDTTQAGSHPNDLYYYKESTNEWINFRTSHFDFSGGNGYLAANEYDSTHVFTGTLNNADITVSGLTYTSGQGNGWHLLGNPFPSALTWGDANWSLSNVAETAKIWNESAGNYSDISSNGIIPSTNGFLVQVSSSTNSLTIPVADRVHDATNNFKSSQEQPKETLKIKVTNDANDYYDVSTLGFKSEATADYDLAFDSHKLFGLVSTAPSLYTVSKNQKFSTDYLPYSNANIEVPLSFKAGVDGTYHLTFSGIDSFDANSSITLEDLFTGKTVDVRKNQTYSYTAAKEDANNRFVLHFYNVTSTPEIGEANNKALIYSYNNNIIVKATDKQLNGKVEIINILGQTMETKSVSNSNFFTINTNLNKGVYIVRYTETNGYTQAQKVIIN